MRHRTEKVYNKFSLTYNAHMEKELYSIPCFVKDGFAQPERVYRGDPNKLRPLPSGKFKTPASVIRYTNSFLGRMGTLIKGAKASSKESSRNLKFSITRDDLVKLWDKQKGLCSYTGWEMSTQTKNQRLVSIERIDNSLGYVDGNLILVCWCANRARNTMTKTDFIDMCKQIAKHNP